MELRQRTTAPGVEKLVKVSVSWTQKRDESTAVLAKARTLVGFTVTVRLKVSGPHWLLLMSVMVLTGAALLDSPQVRALQHVRGIDDIITQSLKAKPSVN